jgi:hypothetical protein
MPVTLPASLQPTPGPNANPNTGSPNIGSTLYYNSGNNRTSTAISTNIIITVRSQKGYVPVGAVQSMAVSEKRPIKMVDEVGTDGHIDSVPNQSTNITGSCQRVRFDRLRVAEAFSRGFVHASSQVYPFDIVIFDQQKLASGLRIATTIKNVWISGIDYTYQVSDWVITDTMTWEAETIFSILNSGNSPVAVGGELGLDTTHFVPIEQATDTGLNGRRGSLDAPGLIDVGSAAYSPPGTAIY